MTKKQPRPDLCPETLRWVAEQLPDAISGNFACECGLVQLLETDMTETKRVLRNLATRAEKKRGKR